MFKSGYVAIIGKPNVGKSSLLNKLVGYKVSITTPKPQTTRFDIKGIITNTTSQIVFVDTPGFNVAKHKLDKYMQEAVKDASNNADIIMYMIDAKSYRIDQITKQILEIIIKSKKKIIFCINKIDIIKKENLLKIISMYTEYIESQNSKFIDIIPISVYTSDGIDLLTKSIIKNLPEGKMIYSEDYYTDLTERQIVEENIREKLLIFLKEEVPHGINVIVTSFKEEQSNNQTKYVVDVDILCKKKSHKAIIIGKDGSMIKKIRIKSQKELTDMLDKKIDLNLWVKIRQDWQENDNFLKNIKSKI